MKALLDGYNSVIASASAIFQEKSAVRGTSNIARLGEVGLRARMADKMARLEHSDTPGPDIDDALIDILNYAAIWLMVRSGIWPETAPVAVDESDCLRVRRFGSAQISAPKKPGDVGYDLAANESVSVLPIEIVRKPTYVKTGVALKAPAGVWFSIRARSCATAMGLLVTDNAIDNGFTGELLVGLVNLTGAPVQVKIGDRLAQVIFFPVVVPTVARVEELPTTARGDTGFGSTGAAVGPGPGVPHGMPQRAGA